MMRTTFLSVLSILSFGFATATTAQVPASEAVYDWLDDDDDDDGVYDYGDGIYDYYDGFYGYDDDTGLNEYGYDVGNDFGYDDGTDNWYTDDYGDDDGLGYDSLEFDYQTDDEAFDAWYDE